MSVDIAIELACLARVQGLAMKSAWESSGGPEQDTETETERERERGRLSSPDKIPLFICRPSPSLLPSIHPFLYHQPFLFYFNGNQAKPFQKPARSRQHVSHCEIPILLKPNTSCQIWQPCRAGNKLAVHE